MRLAHLTITAGGNNNNNNTLTKRIDFVKKRGKKKNAGADED